MDSLLNFGDLVQFVTDFGDAAILLPISVVVFSCLALCRAVRAATAWALANGICIAAMGILKIIFRTCGGGWTDHEVVSPSGHTALSGVVYGGLACLFVIHTRHLWLRWTIAVLTLAWVVLIGISRVLTGAHTPAEVAFGWGVGAAITVIFFTLVRRAPVARTPLIVISLLVALLLFILHGQHSHIEGFIILIVSMIHQNFSVCT